jgi:hypothetical protein
VGTRGIEPWGPAYNNVAETSARSHNLRTTAKEGAMGTALAGKRCTVHPVGTALH